jgi:flagellin
VAAAINLLSDEHGVVATNNAGVLTLNSVAGTEIKIEMEGTATALTTGLNVTNNSSSQGSTVADLNLSTQAGAQSAISIIDTALEQINSSRSELGAINNRLDFTVSNLMNVSENTAAARSRIVDADYAAETANLSRAQVLQQAASAMLAQANAAPQQVLSLLR